MKALSPILFIFSVLFLTVKIWSQDQKNLISSPSSKALFEENKGQMKDQFMNSRQDVLYYGTSEGMNYYIKNSGMSYQLSRVENWKNEENPRLVYQGKKKDFKQIPDQIGIYRVDSEWIGANPNFTIVQGKEFEGYNNYYNVPEGLEPALYVKKYETITLKNVWDGIDLHYYGTDNLLETDYLVAAGADYKNIQIQFKGAEISTDDNGNLIIKTPFGEIHEGTLKVYQNNKRIEAFWKIKNDNVVTFEIPHYNSDLALRIDPLTRVWGTYFGGSDHDESWGLSVDVSGNVYNVGVTKNTSLIATVGAYQTTHGTGANYFDCYLVKFNSSGIREWGTYYGGNSDENAFSVKAFKNGDVYIVGQTHNTNTNTSSFASIGAHQSTFGGTQDAFIAKFNTSGIRQWGTYYGGSNGDIALDVNLDEIGNVYVTGQTKSTNAIATSGVYQSVYSGVGYDAFLVKFNSSGVRQWGTYYGGNGDDIARDIVIDPNGNMYLLGETNSTNAISSTGSHQTTFGGGTMDDVFLVKFNSLGNRLWGTYYGGNGSDRTSNLVLDSDGNIYIAGTTNSNSSISTNGSHQTTIGGGMDAFLVKFNSLGIRQWGSYYGGIDYDGGDGGLAIDSDKNIYMAGDTYSISAISTIDSYQSTIVGGRDIFLVKFNNLGVRQWGSYFGGSNLEISYGDLDIDAKRYLYISGTTNSNSGIATLGAHQTTFVGSANDAFIVKFQLECSKETATTDSFNTPIYKTSSPVILNAEPSGGTFSSPAVINNIFKPAKAKLGKNFVNYNFKNSTGCSDSTIFSVVVSDTVGNVCSTYDTLKIKVKFTLGLYANTTNTIMFYPNPTKDVLFIDNGNYQAMSGYSIKIVSLTGAVVYNQPITSQQVQISMNQFATKGLYIAQILDSNNAIVDSKKIVLE